MNCSMTALGNSGVGGDWRARNWSLDLKAVIPAHSRHRQQIDWFKAAPHCFAAVEQWEANFERVLHGVATSPAVPERHSTGKRGAGMRNVTSAERRKVDRAEIREVEVFGPQGTKDPAAEDLDILGVGPSFSGLLPTSAPGEEDCDVGIGKAKPKRVLTKCLFGEQKARRCGE